MPTVNNGGRFLWGSTWRLEPSSGKKELQALTLCQLLALRAPLASFSVCYSRRCYIRCRHGHLPPLATVLAKAPADR
jgi:hypothetical protein